MTLGMLRLSLLLCIPTSWASANKCESKSSHLRGLQEISDRVHSAKGVALECAEAEVFEPLFSAYRRQSLAMSLCQKNSDCLTFLRSEASRVSGLTAEKFAELPAVALWGEIQLHSGRTRRAPPKLSDLPLPKNPEEVYEELKREAEKDKTLQNEDRLKLACSVLVGLIGPGKFKVLTAARVAPKIQKIEMSHDIEKLIAKNRIPPQVKEKFLKWSDDIEKKGLQETKKIPGYHDEPLAGLPGWHSVRLNGGYRACYEIIEKNGLQILRVFSISNDHKNYCR